MKTNSRIQKKELKKKAGKKKIFYILLPFIILFLSATVYGVYLFVKANQAVSESYEDAGREKSDLREEIVDPTKDNVSVLIIGVDASEKRAKSGNNLSDTLIFATLNKKENSIKLLSIPRDSYVYIPKVGYEDKINHAHSYGGPAATIETVENLLEVPVDYFVSINFEAFIDIIDSLDGVTVNVPFEIYEQNSKDKKDAIHLLPGQQSLNGEEALAFARTRKYDNDFERGKRQQEIIKAIIKKATSIGSVLKYGDIIDTVGENMKTNMTFPEIQGLITYGIGGKGLSIESLSLTGHDYWPGRVYYFQLDEQSLEETKQELKEHLGIVSTARIGN